MAFKSKKFLFAGLEEMTLTVFEDHLLKRFSERMGIKFNDGQDCLNWLDACLQDERLIRIYEKVPVYATVVLYVESKKLYLIMMMGTQKDPNEVKVNTVLYRSNEKMRLLVQETDNCYVLPSEGKLRYGTEKKYFERNH